MKKKIRNLICPLLIMCVLLILAISCKKDDPIIKKDVTITWANPADITVGTLLSATQLNATADVLGTFVYTPAISASLAVGANQDLKVDFTPANVANYNVASKTVKINVIANTFTDPRDGNVYHLVTIGTQVWMAENLRYLPSVVGQTTNSQTTPYYYVYGYNGTSVTDAKATDNYATYGVLYNWPAAMAGSVSSAANPSGVQGVCPTGWHLPSDAEWIQLTTYLDGANVSGGKLKETGTTHWYSPNDGATNETGFSALPGGLLRSWSTFRDIGYYGYWWSATEEYSGYAFGRYLSFNYSGVNRYNKDNSSGLSVRCLRD